MVSARGISFGYLFLKIVFVTQKLFPLRHFYKSFYDYIAYYDDFFGILQTDFTRFGSVSWYSWISLKKCKLLLGSYEEGRFFLISIFQDRLDVGCLKTRFSGHIVCSVFGTGNVG